MVVDSSGADRLRKTAPLAFGRIVVIGGGCYGAWYTRQLSRAVARHAIAAREIVVVNRNPKCRVADELAANVYGAAPVRLEIATWAEYLATWLAQPLESLTRDAMVPSPLMPHLCFDWLMARAKQRWPDRVVAVEPLTDVPPMPWERGAPDGRHYVSYATWTCPINCIEPAKCPATRGARDWSMPPALRDFVANHPATLDRALIFHCEHRTYGVGMIDALAIAQSRLVVDELPADRPQRVLVGTVSHCHGALGVLSIS